VIKTLEEQLLYCGRSDHRGGEPTPDHRVVCTECCCGSGRDHFG
jgi:hypothetical protein